MLGCLVRLFSRFMIMILILLSCCLTLKAESDKSGRFSVSSQPVTIPPYGSDEKQPGLAGAVSGKINNVLFLGGGANFPEAPPWENGEKAWYRSAIVFEKSKRGKWEPRPERLELPEKIAYAASVTTPYGLAVLGGENEKSLLNSAYLLDWDTQKKNLKYTPLPSLPLPCAHAAAVWFESRIYLCGGVTPEETTNRVYSLDPLKKSSSWREEPRLPLPVAFTVAVRQSDGTRDRIWLIGGRSKNPADSTTKFYDSLWSWHSGLNQWNVHSPIQNGENKRQPLAAGTGISCGASGILLFGGDDGKIFRQREILQTKIQQTSDSSEKSKLLADYVELSKNHPGFDKTIYFYNTITDQWTVCAELPFKTPVTTAVIDLDGEYVFPSGEISPGIRIDQLRFLKSTIDTKFGLVNYSILFLYMLAMLGIGFLFIGGNKDSEDFFHCGGKIPWWAMGISLFATMLSAITFLAIPAKAYATNWTMIFFNLGIALSAPFVIAFYLPRFRKFHSISAYQFLEERFNRTTRWFASGLFCLFMISRIAIVLYLPAIALNVVTGMNVHFCILVTGLVTLVYSTAGGMKAVVWGDVVQGFILVGGAMISLFWLIFHTNGGWNGFIQLGSEFQKFHAFDLSFNGSSTVFWFVLLGGCASHFITYTSDQTVIQRYMSTADQKESIRSIWLNALMTIPITLVFFLIGTALFTFYTSHPEQMSPQLKPLDAIYPYYIVTCLPSGVSGLLVAAVFAASMSTLSSNINSAAATICSDFIRVFRPNLSAKREIVAARSSGVIVGLLGIGMACILATWNIQSLWDQFNTFLGMFTGTLGALFFMGFFMKKVNGFGAILGIFGSVLLLAFIQKTTSVSFLLYAPIEIVICCLIAFLTSLVTGQQNTAPIDNIKENPKD